MSGAEVSSFWYYLQKPDNFLKVYMSYGPQSLLSNVISSTGTDEVNYWNNDARIDSGKYGNFEEQD